MNEEELYHHGVLGQKWGVRHYQNADGSLKPAGVKRAAALKRKYTSITSRSDPTSEYSRKAINMQLKYSKLTGGNKLTRIDGAGDYAGSKKSVSDNGKKTYTAKEMKKLMKKDNKKLSNDELRAITERIKSENEIKRIKKEQRENTLLGKVITGAKDATKDAAVNAIKDKVTDVVSNNMREKLGLITQYDKELSKFTKAGKLADQMSKVKELGSDQLDEIDKIMGTKLPRKNQGQNKDEEPSEYDETLNRQKKINALYQELNKNSGKDVNQETMQRAADIYDRSEKKRKGDDNPLDINTLRNKVSEKLNEKAKNRNINYDLTSPEFTKEMNDMSVRHLKERNELSKNPNATQADADAMARRQEKEVADAANDRVKKYDNSNTYDNLRELYIRQRENNREQRKNRQKNGKKIQDEMYRNQKGISHNFNGGTEMNDQYLKHANFAYTRKYMKNGKWVYEYPEDTQNSYDSARNKAAYKSGQRAANLYGYRNNSKTSKLNNSNPGYDNAKNAIASNQHNNMMIKNQFQASAAAKNAATINANKQNALNSVAARSSSNISGKNLNNTKATHINASNPGYDAARNKAAQASINYANKARFKNSVNNLVNAVKTGVNIEKSNPQRNAYDAARNKAAEASNAHASTVRKGNALKDLPGNGKINKTSQFEKLGNSANNLVNIARSGNSGAYNMMNDVNKAINKANNGLGSTVSKIGEQAKNNPNAGHSGAYNTMNEVNKAINKANRGVGSSVSRAAENAKNNPTNKMLTTVGDTTRYNYERDNSNSKTNRTNALKQEIKDSLTLKKLRDKLKK